MDPNNAPANAPTVADGHLRREMERDTGSSSEEEEESSLPTGLSHHDVDERSEDGDDDDNDTAAPTSAFGAHRSAGPGHVSMKVQYDVQDHTVAAVPTPHAQTRVWVLPRALLPPSMLPPQDPVSRGAHMQPCHSTVAGDGRESTLLSPRSSTQSNAAAAAVSSGPDRHRASLPSSSTAAGGSATPSSLPLQARVVRIPHPRHAQPTLYLVQPHRAASSTAPLSAASLLFEVQAQAPPSDFAQSWFVGETVVPSTPHMGELLVATPVDLAFFALAELLGSADVYARLSQKFMSAGDLYRSGEGRPASSTPAPASAVAVDAPAPSSSGEGEASAYVSVFGNMGNAGQEDSQSSDSASPIYSFPSFTATGGLSERCVGHHNDSHPPSSTVFNDATRQPSKPTADAASHVSRSAGWTGWAHATAEHPLLFSGCLSLLQSDAVLRRICEVREIGEDLYYRPSETVAVAWLARKVLQLQRSAVLRDVLQLPELDATAASPAADVPVAMALGMVAEYVPERLHSALAVACGLPDPATATAPSTAASSSLAGGKRDREGQGLTSSGLGSDAKGVGADASATASSASAGPKSASVKRLEKAGRPKGTPTLFSMFAKKKSAE